VVFTTYINLDGVFTRYRSPMDMHLVHISSSIGRGGSAIQPREIKDGLVVVCFHFEVIPIINIKDLLLVSERVLNIILSDKFILLYL
jgi:hypothetical protein